MNRSDFQRLSNARIREARILYEAGEYSGAYYLAGYAVECALKACFAKTVKRYDFPDKSGAGKIFTHNLIQLIELINLKKDLRTETQVNSKFEARWNVVCKWSEESRYSTWGKDDATAMIDAIVAGEDGILPWIKRRW